MGTDTKTLEDRIGHTFAEPDLLRRALTHASTLEARSGQSYSYERLEFLGDRVLGMAIADLLYKTFPDEDEGALSKRLTALVRREALARVAKDAGFAPDIRLAASEDETGGRDNPGILADVCEAVIAALYLDGGMDAVRPFIDRYWTDMVSEDATPPQDAKTTLQEWAQGKALGLPTYREVSRQGPSHAPVFLIEVAVEGIEPAKAEGPSKRAAEQDAASALLRALDIWKPQGT